MTDQEWENVAGLLRHWWPGDFSASAAEAYRIALDRFAVADVARVLGDMLGNGQRFRPSASELVGVLAPSSATPHPAPEEAIALVLEAVRRVGRSVYAPDFHEHHQAAVDWLATQDPVVAAFAARRGLCGPGSIGHEPVEDPEHGGAVMGALRKDYREALQVAEEREARGLPAVELRQLQVRATAAQSGGMADVVRRLRPSDQIGPGDAASGE